MSFFDDASLLLIPSGYKDDKLYSIKPTDGGGDFTFSRDGSGASPATRINSSGLIEKGHTNQILQSNQFDTTWGVSAGASVSSGQSGYDGTTNAWRFTKDSEFDAVSQDTSALGITGVNTISVYVKRVDVDVFILRQTIGGSTAIIQWDLTDGSLISANAAYIAPVDGVAIGSTGWYRFSGTFNGTLSEVQLRMDAAVAAGSIDIQAVQVQKGLVATDYIDTTTAAASAGLLGDMPRLDYSGGASCPCVLMEPARTNKVTHSEWLGGWSASEVTLDFGYLSPDGTNNAYKVTANGSQPYIVAPAAGTIQPTDARTIYAKTTSGTGTAHLMTHNSNTNNLFTITDEWQRFEITSVTSTTGQNNFYGVDLRGSSSLTEILIWGAQCEEHPTATADEANATSYIPTYGTSASRGDDATSYVNVGTLSTATIFGDVTFPNVVRDGGDFSIELRTAADAGLYAYRNNSTLLKRANFYKRNDSGTASFVADASTDRIKFALQYNGANGSLKLYVNGSNALASPITDTDFSDFTRFRLTGAGGIIRVDQLGIIPTTYTNDELATLTTL